MSQSQNERADVDMYVPPLGVSHTVTGFHRVSTLDSFRDWLFDVRPKGYDTFNLTLSLSVTLINVLPQALEEARVDKVVIGV